MVGQRHHRLTETSIPLAILAMVELFCFGSDLMCGSLKALPCKNRRFGGENWFPPLLRTYSKSTTASFFVPARTLIEVKQLKVQSEDKRIQYWSVSQKGGFTP
jgi:hypothetical protein